MRVTSRTRLTIEHLIRKKHKYYRAITRITIRIIYAMFTVSSRGVVVVVSSRCVVSCRCAVVVVWFRSSRRRSSCRAWSGVALLWCCGVAVLWCQLCRRLCVVSVVVCVPCYSSRRLLPCPVDRPLSSCRPMAIVLPFSCRSQRNGNGERRRHLIATSLPATWRLFRCQKVVSGEGFS